MMIGLFWALCGAVLGVVAGLALANLIIAITNASNREGAHGYLTVLLGLLGGVIGLVAGPLYGQSAMEGPDFLVSLILGVVGAAVWIALENRYKERPVEYAGKAMADLLLELRMETARLPVGEASNWFSVEVQTSSTRPTGVVLWDQQRTEGQYSVFPVVKGPLIRAGSRIIVVNVPDRQTEAFRPPMKRVPDPTADWSEWYGPLSVDPPYGVVPDAPPKGLFELRYRLRRYGD